MTGFLIFTGKNKSQHKFFSPSRERQGAKSCIALPVNILPKITTEKVERGKIIFSNAYCATAKSAFFNALKAITADFTIFLLFQCYCCFALIPRSLAF